MHFVVSIFPKYLQSYSTYLWNVYTNSQHFENLPQLHNLWK